MWRRATLLTAMALLAVESMRGQPFGQDGIRISFTLPETLGYQLKSVARPAG